MDQTEKLSISLPASLAKLVRDKVKSGAYASNSEFIRDALRTFQLQEAEQAAFLVDARRQIAEAIDDPRPPRSASKVSARMKTLHERTVKARRRAR